LKNEGLREEPFFISGIDEHRMSAQDGGWRVLIQRVGFAERVLSIDPVLMLQ